MELDSWTAALLTSAACGVGALVVLVHRVTRHQQATEKIQRARKWRTESLERAEQAVLRYRDTNPQTDSDLILSLTLSDLTKQLKEGTLSRDDVLHSYMEKALDINRKVNCCTEILLECLDQLKTVPSNNDGLLYGVPISIKENVNYKNHVSSCGVVVYLDQPAEEDSVLVKVLKRQGAIPFVKTNIPQGLLSYDCSNPIFGQTLNPHNSQKTCGGSSGGEGALIGGGGSLLGIGSDLGGSIRIPASFCGICGFKPTSGRISLQGVKPLFRGQKSVLASPGPMAKDVDSLVLCMQALLCDHMFSLDPTVPPLPFNMQIYQSSRPLRIGYLENDGYTQPSPSMARCVREVKALLEQAGHTLVPYHLQNVSYALPELMLRGVIADGGSSVLQKLEGSPLDASIRAQIFHCYFPKWWKKTLSLFFKPLGPRVSTIFSTSCGVGSVADLWAHHAAVEDYINETIAFWRKINIDVLLCPMIGPAYNHCYYSKICNSLSYTMLYNLLNFPAGVVPVSTVTVKDEEELKHYKGMFQDAWDEHFKQAVSGGEGLPVAVQCVALPWQEELCLRLMKEVEQLVKQSRR
ncbi:vitamin D3 hydroxylase-associated protein-like [Betta splendens]|uniref:Fatty-acid amide hydrolase 1 n=1 Tax=Betta splendens TaxID=158456 RepID=A0A6P7M9Q4_BETSP|nr:vitamin D3 hydroxylase-associated protein-like [Betta splendens]XP_029002929.1 vitamin D3 hydroxylase-associated protein-like [Betta splendens]XP_055364284.1 vitamin D3 hydroxylase-associated protein-like [Betta splendens]